MWCWRTSVTHAAAVFAIAAASVVVPPAAFADAYRINNVDHSARIHLRESASNRSKVIGYLPTDARLDGTGNCDTQWCQVTFKGQTGWVFRKYLVADVRSVGGARLAAAQPQQVPTVAALPPVQPDAPKEIPPDLQDTMLRLVFTGGRSIPVYTFPNDRLPAAGRIPLGTEEVEDLGTCTRNFCYIRSGSLVGWIAETAIAKADKAPGLAQAIDTTVPTATLTAAATDSLIDGLGSTEMRSYTLAGLSGDASLPVQEAPREDAAIIGLIPGEAKGVEGLRKCMTKWCLVRYEALTGWVARRHLADESSASQRFQVSGVALWGALDVVDYPGSDAAVVGHIPSYATGIVPIGGCDKDWCHVRYLGIAGWVSGKYIEPQKR